MEYKMWILKLLGELPLINCRVFNRKKNGKFIANEKSSE